MGLPLKNFVKIKASPPKNSIFFNSTPKEILNFYNLPQENSVAPQPGGGGVRILNAIAQYCGVFNWNINFYLVSEDGFRISSIPILYLQVCPPVFAG